MSSEACIKSILNSSLLISKIDTLNDPYDMTYGLTELPPELTDDKRHNLAEKIRSRVNDIFGVICFSRSYSIPTMWAHYADNHKGICLIFDSADFPDNIGDSLIPVIYDNKRITISCSELHPSESGSRGRSESYHNSFKKSLHYKSKSWEYEEETRLIISSEKRKIGKGFYPLKPGMLKGVILGYNCDYTVANIEKILESSKFEGVEVHKTSLSQTHH